MTESIQAASRSGLSARSGAPVQYGPLHPITLPYVSLITRFDKGGSFHATARSILTQSFQQWEWLIVNDATEPSDAAALLPYRSTDPRIRVIDHDSATSVPAARNTGCRASTAPYILPLASDEVLEATALEKWCWFLASYPEYSFAKGCTMPPATRPETRALRREDALTHDAFLPSAHMLRRSVYARVGGYNESLPHDLAEADFWLKCTEAGYRGGIIPEPLSRRHAPQQRAAGWGHLNSELREPHTKLHRGHSELWSTPSFRARLDQDPHGDAISPDPPFTNPLAKDKRRLLMVLPWLTLGGADKFTLNLANQLAPSRWDITIVTTLSGDDSLLSSFAERTSDIFQLGHFVRLPEYPRFLKYIINSRQSDIVLISNSEAGYRLLPYLRAHCPNTAFVDLCHAEDQTWKNGGYPRMSVEHGELLDLDIVASDHLREWMIAAGGDSGRITVSHANVDPDHWRPDARIRKRVRGELQLDESTGVILYAGRVYGPKQPHVFAKTIRRLSRTDVAFEALVAGEGPDLRWLRSFVKRHGLAGRTHFLGVVSEERMREVMATVDVFFLPSRWEGIALSIYEAMASGLPVVAADVGGQRELVSPACGILVPRSDPNTESRRYAEALGMLLSDAARRKAMGEAARARVSEHFRLDQMSERMVALLERAIELHERQPRRPPDVDFAHAAAAQAIKYVRLSEMTHLTWRSLEGPDCGRSSRASRSVRAYATLVRLGYPFYRWGMSRGLTWLPALRERIEKALLRTR